MDKANATLKLQIQELEDYTGTTRMSDKLTPLLHFLITTLIQELNNSSLISQELYLL